MSNQDKPPIDEDDPHAGSAFDGRDVARDPFLDDDDDDGDSFDSKSDLDLEDYENFSESGADLDEVEDGTSLPVDVKRASFVAGIIDPLKRMFSRDKRSPDDSEPAGIDDPAHQDHLPEVESVDESTDWNEAGPDEDELDQDDLVVPSQDDLATLSDEAPPKLTRAQRKAERKAKRERKKLDDSALKAGAASRANVAASLKSKLKEQKKDLEESGSMGPLALIFGASFMVSSVAGIVMVQPGLKKELESYDLEMPMIRMRNAQADLEALANLPDLPRLDKAWIEFGRLGDYCGLELSVLNPSDVDGLYRGNVDAWHAAVVGTAARGTMCLAEHGDKYPLVVNQILVDDRGEKGTFNATISILGVLRDRP